MNAERPVMIYELREYVAVPGQREAVHRRFAEGTLALFEKHGLDVAGYWADEHDGDRIVYLMRFADEETRRQKWAAFQGDQDWKALKTASEANGPIVVEMLSRTLTSPAYWPHDTARETP
jgi:hypothetical protein